MPLSVWAYMAGKRNSRASIKGRVFRYTYQWPAVRIHLGCMMEPPQVPPKSTAWGNRLLTGLESSRNPSGTTFNSAVDATGRPSGFTPGDGLNGLGLIGAGLDGGFEGPAADFVGWRGPDCTTLLSSRFTGGVPGVSSFCTAFTFTVLEPEMEYTFLCYKRSKPFIIHDGIQIYNKRTNVS